MPTPPEYADIARQVGANVRAELARHQKTQADLAQRLGISAQTAGWRVSGDKPFTAVEVAIVARWLNVDISALFPADAAEVVA